MPQFGKGVLTPREDVWAFIPIDGQTSHDAALNELATLQGYLKRRRTRTGQLKVDYWPPQPGMPPFCAKGAFKKAETSLNWSRMLLDGVSALKRHHHRFDRPEPGLGPFWGGLGILRDSSRRSLRAFQQTNYCRPLCRPC